MSKYLFTSESVSPGHPDKVCDQISDAILDYLLTIDPKARCACETFATSNKVVVGGEFRYSGSGQFTSKKIEEIVREVVREIGYEQENFNWKTLDVEVLMHGQSEHIAMGVDAGKNKEEGAGDQGIMFGFACDENECYMPSSLHYSHKILENLWSKIKSGELPDLYYDAKSQVTLEYEDGVPLKAKKIVCSVQHKDGLSSADVFKIVKPIIIESLPNGWVGDDCVLYINPTGKFVIGGPDGDTGLTGRKIIVDTYGGAAPHGGGAFSGKDCTKVDRSAAYMARYLAKNIVAAGLAKRCTIQLSYAIGISDPLSFYVKLESPAKIGGKEVNAQELEKFLTSKLSLTPAGIKKHLGLERPIYKPTATFGHFGRTPTADGLFSWEKLDLVDLLRSGF